MSPAIYIQANVVSALLCVLLYYEQKKHNAFGFLGTSTFNALLWFTILILTVDISSWLMVADLLPHSAELLMFTQCVYYFLQALLPLLFMDYIIKSCGYRPGPILRLVRLLPLPFTAVVLFLNFERHFAFRIVNNEFLRSDGFMLAILAPMLYIAVSLIFCTVSLLRSRGERRHLAFHLFICILLSSLGAVLSAFVPGATPWHIFVFGLVYFYMRIHSVQERNLDFLAYSDSLTGLKNFTAYSHLKQVTEKKLSQNPNFRFAVALMDINDLKKVNDAYGHSAGNELICRSGQLICDVFRHSPVCRIGGDEFIAILEHSDYENRNELKAQFDALSALTTFSADGRQLPVSVALGISAYQPELHYTFDDVLRDADHAMYEHKALCKTRQ